jgi:AhpD family alkylhydroperoxidase
MSKTAREVYRAIDALDESVVLDERLHDLVRLRASQLNGCAWCVDQHSRDLRSAGEDERRISTLSVWRETPFFDARERAALALTEAMTLLAANGVPDDVYEDAACELLQEELGNLVARLSRSTPGIGWASPPGCSRRRSFPPPSPDTPSWGRAAPPDDPDQSLL